MARKPRQRKRRGRDYEPARKPAPKPRREPKTPGFTVKEKQQLNHVWKKLGGNRQAHEIIDRFGERSIMRLTEELGVKGVEKFIKDIGSVDMAATLTEHLGAHNAGPLLKRLGLNLTREVYKNFSHNQVYYLMSDLNAKSFSVIIGEIGVNGLQKLWNDLEPAVKNKMSLASNKSGLMLAHNTSHLLSRMVKEIGATQAVVLVKSIGAKALADMSITHSPKFIFSQRNKIMTLQKAGYDTKAIIMELEKN